MDENVKSVFAAGVIRKDDYERAFSKTVMQSLPGSFSIYDAHGRIVWWNECHRDEITGKQEDEMLFSNALEVFHPADKACASESMQNILNLGIEVTLEGRVLLRGGPKYQWRKITGRRIMVDGIPFVIASGIDITARKRFESLMTFRLRLLNMMDSCSAEELLKASLDEAERLTESSIGFCHFISEDQTTISLRALSTSMKSQTLKSKKNVSGHYSLLNDKDIYNNVIREKSAVIYNNGAASENSPSLLGTSTGIKRKMCIPIIRDLTVAAIFCVEDKPYDYDEDDSKIVSTLANLAWDIVSRKRSQQSELNMQEVLLKAQYMRLAGELAGGIAKDFNTMLGEVLGNVEMALSRKIFDKSLLHNLQAILNATVHSAILTTQFLAFSQHQSVLPVVLELNMIIEKMLVSLKQDIGSNISLVWTPSLQNTSVKIDPEQIKLMIGNLCTNSREAITSKGNITIETSVQHVDKTQCRAGHICKKAGDYVILSVNDDGCGIESNILPHIYEPFFTTKKSTKSSGMGLSTIYGIVKQNNGYIACRSNQDKGTTFSIYLPLHKQYSELEKPEQPLQIVQGKKTILLVDDEPDILNICKLVLEDQGYTILNAAAPEEALQIASNHNDTIHLLLTGVVLPEMNGCELSKVLRLLYPDLKTLFISSCNTCIDSNNEGDPEIHFIQKPFTINTLLLSIRKIFGPL